MQLYQIREAQVKIEVEKTISKKVEKTLVKRKYLFDIRE